MGAWNVDDDLVMVVAYVFKSGGNQIIAKIITVLIGGGLLAMEVWAAPEDVRFLGGARDGWVRCVMSDEAGLGGAQVSLSSGANQLFDWTQAAPGLAPLMIEVEDPQNTITNGGTIRVSVPAEWPCRFDTAVIPATSGSAAGKVGVPTYSGDGRAVVIPVMVEFEAGDAVSLSGLKLIDLRFVPADIKRLELDFNGDGVRDKRDLYTLQVRVKWTGGNYDGSDHSAMTQAESLAWFRGTAFKIR